MKICADIGNSNAVIGLWHNGGHQIWGACRQDDKIASFRTAQCIAAQDMEYEVCPLSNSEPDKPQAGAGALDP